MRLRRALSIILAVCMILSSVSVAYAGEIPEITETKIGTSGETVTEDQTVEVTEGSAAEVTDQESETAETASPSEDTEETEETGETLASPSEIILEDTAEDGVKVTLKADPDTFEYSEGLTLAVTVVSEEEAEKADKELKSETKDDNIAKRVTYDIKVMHGDEELEPVDGSKVRISFRIPDVPAGADNVNVYHHDESANDGIDVIVDNARIKSDEIEVGSEETAGISEDTESASEKAAATEAAVTEVAVTTATEDGENDTEYLDGGIIDDVTVEGETTGFSLYTVDFTYEDKMVCLDGGNTGRLSDILADIDITGDIEKAEAYNDAACTSPAENGEVKEGNKVLFRVYEENGAWFVDAVNAFLTEHGIKVTMTDGSEYCIKVTDATALADVKYIDENGLENVHEGLSMEVSDKDFTWTDGWYVVSGDISVSEGYTVEGDVKLILATNSNLVINAETGKAAINVTGDSKLTIYTQATGSDAGTVTAEGGAGAAGIGGDRNQSGKNISVFGGNIFAIGKGGGAGIGGGYNGAAEDITIAAGKVTASATAKTDSQVCGAGIGSGAYRDAEGITITGGSVSAKAAKGAAAIGGGLHGAAENILISGDGTKVYAFSGGEGAGIGGGYGALESSHICIESGYVEALSTEGRGIGAGTGGSCNDIYVNTANMIYASDSSTCIKEDGSLDKTEMTRFKANKGQDLSDEKNIQKRCILICNNTETKEVTVNTQTGDVTYGTVNAVKYTVTGTEINDKNVTIKWYSDAGKTEPCEAPKGITVETGSGCCRITNGTKTPAGDYYFGAAMEDTESDAVKYTISKRPATITSGSAEKAYDGTPLVCEAVTVTGFVNDDAVDVTITGSQTEIGCSQNDFIYIESQGTNLDNYQITEITGTLTVFNAEFTVQAGNYCEKYDADTHCFNDESNGTRVKVIAKNGIDISSKATIEYKMSTDGTPGSWTDWTAEAPSIKDAGKLYIRVKAEYNTASVESAVYTMEVTKRKVTLTSGSDEKKYDGKPLDCQAMSVGGDGFAGTQGAKYSNYATVTKVGAYQNTFDYVLNGGAETKNYDITVNYGTLTVTPKTVPITIESKDVTKTYDGVAIKNEALTYSTNFNDIKCSGDELKVTFTHSASGEHAAKDAGTYSNSFTYQIIDGNGEDVTNCYTFADPEYGTLTIARRNVILTSGNDMKVKTQAGDYAYNDTVSTSGDVMLEGDTLVYSGFPTVTEISYTPTDNTFSYAAGSGSTFNERNYNIKCVYGKLMLVEEMSIIGEDATVTYNGREQKVPVQVIDNGQGAPVNVMYATSKDNETWSEYSTAVPSITDAGTLYIKAKATKGVQEKDAAYSATIVPRSVTITSDSATMSYNGTALTSGGYSFEGEGFVDGQGVTVTVTGSQTEVGSSENAFNYEFTGSTKAENYIITKNPGTLTVTANTTPITIKTGDAGKNYDGTALTCSDYTVTWGDNPITDNKLAGNDVLEVTTNGSITDAGTVKNTCSYRVVRDGKDVTNSYDIEVVGGTLTVEPQPIVIKTGSAAKKYDGQPLTANEYTVSGRFVSGEGFDVVEVKGTRTNAGTAENIAAYTLKEGTTASNYSITVEPGTLTVTKRKVTVTSGSSVAKWCDVGGEGLTNPGITISGDGFVAGEMTEGYPKATGHLEKPITEPSKKDPVTANNTITYSWAENGNPANYEITEKPGTLKIVCNSVATAIGINYEGIYDSKSHTGSFVTTVQEPYTVQYSTDGGVNWSLNEPKYTDASDSDRVVLVQITNSSGDRAICSYRVKINKRQVTLTAGSAESVYDGTALTCPDYIVGGDGFVSGEEPSIEMTADSTQTDVGTAANTIKDLKVSGSFNPDNYDIAYAAGTLNVTKRHVTLTSDDPEYEYDGFAHSSTAVTVSGDGFVTGQGVTCSNFAEAVNAGRYLNTFEYCLNDVTEEGNYDIRTNYGTLTVNPRDITIKSESAEKVYDGTPLTNSGYSISAGGFTGEEQLDISAVGTITEAGEVSNTIVCKDNGPAKVLNYNIRRDEGTLKVVESAKLRVIAEDQVYGYDGELHGEAAKAYVGTAADDAIVWYAVGDSHIWTDEVPQISELGTITVKARVYKKNYKTAETSYTITVCAKPTPDPKPDPTPKSSGSSGSSWTSAPVIYGSPTAPLSNGKWGNAASGTWQYKVNGEIIRNAAAWILYTGADGKSYTGCFFFDKNGNMLTGWQKIDNIWYFFDTAPGSAFGMMKTSVWITTDGKQYYVGADGRMLANTITPDGHKVDATGARID